MKPRSNARHLSRGRRAAVTALLCALAGASCGRDAEPQAAPTSAPQLLADGTEVHGVHPVRCGCAIAAIGHCGNYVDLDGRVYEITGDVGLDEMAFCGEDGVRATVAGTIQDGALVATSVVVEE